MKAFAILDGGGVKGAALAGCLAAAEDQGIEFAGYGGTSAGAIVALLASVGYKGREIRDILLDEIEPKSLLDDQGVELGTALRYGERFERALSSRRAWPLKAWEIARLLWESTPFLKRLWKNSGLYKGEAIRRVLLRKVVEKLTSLQGQTDITFDDLSTAACTPLKLVASNTRTRRAAVFSQTDVEYGTSIFSAVRASSCYPFLFQPLVIGDARLVDGGLSSNLPTFLFADEHEATQYPILAFDLVEGASASPSPYRLGDFGKELMGTALEASDDLFVRLMRGVYRIKVLVPAGIHTLKFLDLSRGEIEHLYDRGYAVTRERLDQWPRLSKSKEAGGELQRQLWTLYEDPKLFRPPLEALAKQVEDRTGAELVRSQVMLPTGRPDRKRIVTYHFGFRQTDPDSDLELFEFGGCTGKALRERSPTFADLEEAQSLTDEELLQKWTMTREQQSKVAQDRKAMVSVPIFAWSKDTGEGPDALPILDTLPILGILSIDSSTRLAHTGWVEDTSGTRVLKRDIFEIMRAWADVISKLVRQSL